MWTASISTGSNMFCCSVVLGPGYSVGSLISSRGSQLYVAGAPRFNHTGKVIVFSLRNSGNLTILQALLGEQVPRVAPLVIYRFRVQGHK